MTRWTATPRALRSTAAAGSAKWPMRAVPTGWQLVLTVLTVGQDNRARSPCSVSAGPGEQFLADLADAILPGAVEIGIVGMPAPARRSKSSVVPEIEPKSRTSRMAATDAADPPPAITKS